MMLRGRWAVSQKPELTQESKQTVGNNECPYSEVWLYDESVFIICILGYYHFSNRFLLSVISTGKIASSAFGASWNDVWASKC